MHYLVKQAVLLSIKLYQACLSSFLGPSCRFSPTCSCYSIEAIEKHGVLMGGWLTVKRILKCNPYNNSECFDPVP